METNWEIRRQDSLQSYNKIIDNAMHVCGPSLLDNAIYITILYAGSIYFDFVINILGLIRVMELCNTSVYRTFLTKTKQHHQQQIKTN